MFIIHHHIVSPVHFGTGSKITVVILQCDILRQPFLFANLKGPFHPPGSVVAGPDQPHLALPHQCIQRAQGLFLRRLAIIQMGIVEVNPVHAQIAQAFFGLLPDQPG